MDAGSRRAAVAVSSATRTAGIRLTWMSSVGMAPSNLMIRNLASTFAGRDVRDDAVEPGELEGLVEPRSAARVDPGRTEQPRCVVIV